VEGAEKGPGRTVHPNAIIQRIRMSPPG
jgi:hypothetical protein